MSDDLHEQTRAKVQAIFTELAGERARMLNARIVPAAITSTITNALIKPDSALDEILRQDGIALHLTDWAADAAFLVALHLFPERFTREEIQQGVDTLLLHVPDHVISAAQLAGRPIAALLGEEESEN